MEQLADGGQAGALDGAEADLAQRIGTECKALRSAVNGGAPDLSALTTTARTNLVVAINELKTELASVQTAAGATINDASVNSATQTWSVNKILFELSATAQATKSQILGGAGASYDTLQELKALLDGGAADVTALTQAIGNRVRFDTANQGLTTQQQQAARTNIAAFGAGEIGNPDADFVTVFTSALN